MIATKGKWGCKDEDKEKHFYVLDGIETTPICRQFGSSVMDIHSGGKKVKCELCLAVYKSD